MPPNLGALTIQRVCFHTIHQRLRGEKFAAAEVNNEIVELSPEVHEIIVDRLATYCGDRSRAFELEIAKFHDTSFYAHAVGMRTASDDDFISSTQKLAHLLAENQNRSNIQTASLFVLDAVDEDGLPVVVCLKAEGTDALTHENREGVTRLIQVKNLFMGRTEKFFKVGLIYQQPLSAANEQLPHEQWGALLYDHQFRTGTEPARYFWDGFLGFSIDKNQKIQSKQAYTAMLEFMEKSLADDVEAKSDALDRLEEYIGNANIETIDFDHIEQTIIPADKRDDFNEAIRNKFTHAIVKDTALLDKKLNQSRMRFQDNLILRGPKKSFVNVDVIENQKDLESLRLGEGYTIICIKGDPDRILRYAEPE